MVSFWYVYWVVAVLCSYQLEALEKAIQQNTIVFLETGSGKTLIAIMLLRSYAHLLRKPSPFIAVFLVPKVVLVKQVCLISITFLTSIYQCLFSWNVCALLTLCFSSKLKQLKRILT